jgi:hypothetical protein
VVIASGASAKFADGARTFPMPDTFVVNASKDQAISAAEAAYLPAGQVTVPFNPMVINTGSKLIAIDTGNGPAAFTASKGAVGQMQSNLAAAGIDASDRHRCYLTHARRPCRRVAQRRWWARVCQRGNQGPLKWNGLSG